jgi:hypothetical protein
LKIVWLPDAESSISPFFRASVWLDRIAPMFANAEFMFAIPVKPTLLFPGRRVTSGRRAVPRIMSPDFRFRVTLPWMFLSVGL